MAVLEVDLACLEKNRANDLAMKVPLGLVFPLCLERR
jgi:hypothetical protein